MIEKSEPVEEKKQVKKGISLAVLILFSLILIFGLARWVVPQVLVYLSGAANQPGEYSLANSYIFGSPLLAKADGQEKIRVSAFLLDGKGRGASDKQIVLSVSPKEGATGTPQVAEVQPITDNFGKAVFEVSSSFVGQFIVSISVDGLEFPQTVTLTFR